jgi:hypothetical protein
MPGHHRSDAVRERGAGQIGIEERNDAANLSNAQPDGEVFWPVPHHQANDFTFGETLVERPSRVLVGALGQLTVGQALAFGEQGRRGAEL